MPRAGSRSRQGQRERRRGGPGPPDRRQRRAHPHDPALRAARPRAVTRGIATLCLGGGNGVALAVELLMTEHAVASSAPGRWATGSRRSSRSTATRVVAARPRRGRSWTARRGHDRQEPREAGREGQAPAAADRDATLARIATATDLGAVAGADLVVEADRREPRRSRPRSSASWTASRRRRPILASNTSSISITKLGAATKRPDKVIGMHFMNPVPLMALVEVIRGQATSDETTRDGRWTSRSALGKTPVEVNDYPRLRLQPRADADDQRGDLRRLRGRGDAPRPSTR